MKILILFLIISSLKLINCLNKTTFQHDDDYYDSGDVKYDYNEDDDHHHEPYKKCPKLCVCEFLNKNQSKDYEDEYDQHMGGYEIDVNCSNRSLKSLNSLFDDEFPIESIVNL